MVPVDDEVVEQVGNKAPAAPTSAASYAAVTAHNLFKNPFFLHISVYTIHIYNLTFLEVPVCWLVGRSVFHNF